uniref:Uncharacterized protein n=1 Tax=viral metagenome TaxID=1070528 RepID=A0A6C0I4E1_9ZZZZ
MDGIDENETEWLNYKVVMPENVKEIIELQNNDKIFNFNLLNLKFEYGIDDFKIDITNIVRNYCLNDEGIINIPTNDDARAQMFSDPLFRTVKYIYISDNQGNELLYDQYQPITINIKNITNLFTSIEPSDLTIYKSPYNKIRLGKDNDGGYIICDIPNINYSILISGGVKDDISFETDFCNKYNTVKCLAFDGSIDNIQNEHSNIRFIQKYIGGNSNNNFTNLHDIINSNDNIFIKMDIEGYEIEWINSLSEEQINKFSQIVIEFHRPFYFEETAVFHKLNKSHVLVHLHVNNACGIRKHKHIKIPNMFECTYINKKYYTGTYKINDDELPTSIDMPNVLTVGDIIINYPPFVFKQYVYNFCIMAIFKNETMNLKIWLDHYLWQGVEHFYLIDNDSNDNPMSILQEYIDKGIVTYYYKPEKHQQVQHYRNVFDNERLKEKTRWLCICDLDEFFFGTEKKLVDAIYEFNGYDIIYTNSFFYGSDNLILHPDDIRTSIIHRQEDIVNGIKYIFKTSCINDTSEIWIHWLVHSGSGSLQKKILSTETFDNKKIRLNHYCIQSLEYYQKVKMTRGDVSILQNENIRDINYFEYYQNISIIKDDILKQIIENDLYYKNGEVMKFYDENGGIIYNNSIEKPEQDLVNQYILEDDIVLELGARYGTVSCAINKKLKNKKNQVSVEPDDRVWNALDVNKIKNACDFNIVKGFVSNKKLGLILDGYGTTFTFDEKTKIPSYSLDEIKTQYGINKFTALVADCEGFLEVFFDENPNLYHDLRFVMFEADYVDKCNYDKIKHNLILHKFVKIIEGHQNIWIKPEFNIDNNNNNLLSI